MVETGGTMDCTLRGGSGETTCFQFMSSSWTAWSTDYVGYVMPKTEGNARYLATLRVSDLLNQGHSAEDTALIWNSGGTTHREGINSYGIAYNTYAYVAKFNRFYR
jgi:hypothetical protein